MTCAERLMQLQETPSEAPAHRPLLMPPPSVLSRWTQQVPLPHGKREEGRRDAIEPPATWPSGGHVSFDGVWLKYRPDLQPVLRGLSFAVRPGEKIGICGRTGG